MNLRIAYITSLHSQYFRNSLYIGLEKLNVEVDLYPRHRIVNPTEVHPCYLKLIEDIKSLENNINRYDYIVVSPRNDYDQKYINKITEITRKADTPLVLVDMSDILEYRPILFSERVVKYFKREFIPPTGKKVPTLHKIRSRLNSVIISCKYYWDNAKLAPILPPGIYTPKIVPFFIWDK